MPRSNRRRKIASTDDKLSLEHLASGWRRTEHRRGSTWNVQPVSSGQAAKIYICPGCELEVSPGVAHIVAWRADGILGDGADIAARRHWHTHCWKIS